MTEKLNIRYRILAIVPHRRVGCCLGPEGNGVNPRRGNDGGPGHPDREQDKQSTAGKEGGDSNMEQEEEGKRVKRDKEDPVCTERPFFNDPCLYV